MVGQTNNTRELLSQIYTEEGRAYVISALAERGEVSKEYVERTVDFLEKKGEMEKAHNLAEKAGMQERARTLETIVRTRQQGEEQEEEILAIDDPDAERLILQYEQAGNSYNSIELCVKVVDAYDLLGRTDKAVETALEHGLVQKALAIREKEADWMHAAIIAEAHELYERAGINYERAKKYGKAGDNFIAEVEKRKNARKKSSNVIVAGLSYVTNILPPGDDALLVRALKNYVHAEWEESEKQTAAKINNKKLVYSMYEQEGRFQAAEEYAVVGGDVARQNLYKTIDCMVHPERKKEGIETRQEQKTQYASKHSVPYKQSLGKKSLFQKAVDAVQWLGTETGKAGIGEMCYTVLKKKVIIPLLGSLGVGGYWLIDYMFDIPHEESSIVERNPIESAPYLHCSAPKNTMEGKLCRTRRWDSVYDTAEAKYGIPEGLLAGVVMSTSMGDPTEISGKYAGLFLLNPDTAKEHGLSIYSTQEHELKKMKKKTHKKTEEMMRHDQRFDIEKATAVAATRLYQHHMEVLEKQHTNTEWKKYDSWDLAVSGFYHGTDHAAKFVNHSGVKRVRDYQSYYLSHT